MFEDRTTQNQGHNIKGQQFGSGLSFKKQILKRNISLACECECGTQKRTLISELTDGYFAILWFVEQMLATRIYTADTHDVRKPRRKEKKTVLLNKLKKQIRGSLRRGLSYKSAIVWHHI